MSIFKLSRISVNYLWIVNSIIHGYCAGFMKLPMDNVTVCMETAYNLSNSTNSTRNLNKNREKSIAVSFQIICL